MPRYRYHGESLYREHAGGSYSRFLQADIHCMSLTDRLQSSPGLCIASLLTTCYLFYEQQMTIVCPKSAVQVQWCELKTETLDCVKAGHKQRPKPGQVPAVDTARITVARMAESTCQSPIKVVLLYHHKNTSHRQGLRNPLVLVKMILSVGTRQCILAVFLNVIVPVFFFDRTPELAFIKNL